MSRIRTIKPEFYKHEALFDAEIESNLPLRVAFSGLWTCADREGRFQWRPRFLKTEVLPYDNVDFSEILEVLAKKEFIVKYEVNEKSYGLIPNFHRHQVIPSSEPPSEIPGVNGGVDGVLTGGQRPPNTTVRHRIYHRDKYTCSYCSDNLKEKSKLICLDQVVHFEHGGTHHENNYVTCCKKCAYIKGKKLPNECGFEWPKGRGINPPVNTLLTPLLTPLCTGGNVGSDQEREREWEKELELERELEKDQVQIHMFNSSVVEPKFSSSSSFKKFWSAYPRRQAKKKSYDIWKRKKLGSIVDIILEDLAQRKDWNAGSQFTPLPTTYLNGERWQDEEKNERKEVKQPNKSITEILEEKYKLEEELTNKMEKEQ